MIIYRAGNNLIRLIPRDFRYKHGIINLLFHVYI